MPLLELSKMVFCIINSGCGNTKQIFCPKKKKKKCEKKNTNRKNKKKYIHR